VPSQQLLTESKIFKDQILSGTERTDNPSQEMPDRRDDGQDHARILSKHASSRFLQIIHSAGARGFDEGQHQPINPKSPTDLVVSSRNGRAFDRFVFPLHNSVSHRIPD
jgi:hypothetical protein